MGKTNSLRNFVLIVLVIIIPTMILAQGVTKSAINGMVTDDKGEPLTGANVVAVHEPSGTSYGAAVRDGGFFDIPNMRVGHSYSFICWIPGTKKGKCLSEIRPNSPSGLFSIRNSNDYRNN